MPDETETTTLGLRLKHSLRQRIKAAAARDGRTESCFARFHLAQAAERALATSAESPPRKKTR